MPIYQTARFRIRPESLPICQAAIKEFLAYIRSNEPGTLYHVSLQEQDDPTSFIHYIAFRDEAGRQAHASSGAVKQFEDVLYPEMIAPVEFTEYVMVASTQAE